MPITINEFSPLDTSISSVPFPLSGYSNIAFTAINQSSTSSTALNAIIDSLIPPTYTPVFPSNPGAPVPLTSSPPTLQPVVWNMPSPPTAFVGEVDIDSLLPEPFDEAPPVLTFGSAPTAFSEVAPSAPGINLQFEYPDLEVSLPAPPSLLSLSVSKFGGLTFPSIDTNIPVLTAVAPSDFQYTPGAQYTSALLTTLKTTLQDRIQNGGTGLPAAIEGALWDRAREREYRQKADALAELERMESLGYALPPGMYLNSRIKIETEINYNIANLSREIAIKQAELELENVLKALDTATQLEGTLINYANQVEQRVFDAARYATEAAISVYNAKVQAYAAYLDAYKTKVAVYEAQIRGELAKVEAYKAEIASEQAKADINRALVDQYKTQADVALANVEIFKAEVGAIQAKAEIEKLKIETFGEQVRAYAAKINAYTAGVEGYRTSIQAEATKQEAFRSQVQAYTAQVDSAVKQIEARIEEYKGRLAAKSTEWDGYRSAAEAESSRARAIAANNQSLVDAYQAEVSGISSYNDVLTKQWQVALDQSQRVAEIGVSAYKANGDLYIAAKSLATDAAKISAQVSAQIGAAALNATNFSNSQSVSYSYSRSNSNSNSVNKTNTRSESASESEVRSISSSG